MVHCRYGPPVHLPQLPTLPRGGAVEVGFRREQPNSDVRDFHPRSSQLRWRGALPGFTTGCFQQAPGWETRPTTGGLEVPKVHFWFYLP